MSIKRNIVLVDSPPATPGFLGAGHLARPLIRRPFADSDPFILLMDDKLDKKDNHPVGGPHPHAGFETVSLLLQGEIGDEAHTMHAGDFQLMTAGSGVVHTETINKPAKMRLLQLWLNLPLKDRWATPRLQDLQNAQVPMLHENGVQIKLYSGELAGLKSPVLNYTPVIIADITIAPDTSTVLKIPANFNGFVYGLSGQLNLGENAQALKPDQVGWLNRETATGQSELSLKAGEDGARFVLYAGKPTGDQIVSHGPFIAGTADEINGLYGDFRQGKMKPITFYTAKLI